MIVKKYPQSHLVLSKNGSKIIIDPGYLTFGQDFKVEQFQGADAYLITHQHDDHLGPETIKRIVGDKPVYGNADVVGKLGGLGVVGIEIKDREKFSVAGFEITPIDLPHFQKPGVEMPPNTGFLIDEIFFHPGDGLKISGLVAEKAAVPISGPPEGEIGFEQGLNLAKSLQAKMIIPIHYDAYPADLEEFKKMAESLGIEVRPLALGEETSV